MNSTGNPWTTNDANRCLKRLDEYRDMVVRLFPALPRRYVDNWSILDVDALALGYFLECYPRKVVALDIGTFIGASAFHLAGQPKVSEVISVDPNPLIADEINDKLSTLGTSIDPEPLQNLKVLDVARAALAEFGDERKKTRLCEGVVGSTQVGVEGRPLDGLEKVEVPVLEPSEEVSLVAFVDGLHTKEGVREDLKAIFDRNPHAVALLDDCRHTWGPFVQAGIVSFMETAPRKYHVQFLGDLGPALASSSLGVVYPDAEAAEMKDTLAMFSGMFSRRLDPLRLLSREEELIGAINQMAEESRQEASRLEELNSQLEDLNSQHVERNSRLEERISPLRERNSRLEERNSRLEERNSRLEERNSRLEERNSRLVARYSSRRYRFVDALVGGVLQMPLIGRLMRRKTTPPTD